MALPLTTSHWGTYRVESEAGRVKRLHDLDADGDPSPIGQGFVDVLDAPSRVTAPMVRRSWLEDGPGFNPHLRGSEPFVEVSWETVTRLVGDEVRRVRTEHGNEAIYGGSYGWSSAGRFHHAQSQLKRFLNTIGGCTRSVNTYSFAAGEVMIPHVLGAFREFVFGATAWQSIVENTELFVAFGGVPLKNAQINQGGIGRHVQGESMRAAVDAGVSFVNVSPIRSDVLAAADAEWVALRPSTDAALMLGLAHTLIHEDLHDQAFIRTCTEGFDEFAAYLSGDADGTVRDASWAAEITEIPADRILELARSMARQRTMISTSWSLTRQDHGEQPFWAAIALASLLGQIGLPGGGFGLGYASVHGVGHQFVPIPAATLPQGTNPVDRFIPVARISDMLLDPGGDFDYNGQRHTYPDIKLVWWAGGNPFHHHQDLNRMVKAWERPDTIICNEWCWNAMAKHADIVLPCTTTLERNDLAISGPFASAMEQAVVPVGDVRDDYEIFSMLATELGVGEAFTQGRSQEEWIEWIWETTRKTAANNGLTLPDLEGLREHGWLETAKPDVPRVMLDHFRADPENNPLMTPSGRIELFSATVDSFGYDDCVGHPAWYEPVEWLGNGDAAHPLHLISNQPHNKLHSQLDQGPYSRSFKVHGREPMTIHPDDAAERNIVEGDLVRVFNERGACFAAATLSSDVRRRVIQLATGAWFDPLGDGATCRHGNPNAVTLDKGTSRLAQGSTAHSCVVQVERFDGTPPDVLAFAPPEIISDNRDL